MDQALWTRRRLLRRLPTAVGPLILPAPLRAACGAASTAPFFAFVDVAASAGLTQPVVYGDPEQVTYIVEITGCGCAFFDYDNDGWMDILMLGGRRLQDVPAEATNRLYHNNRDGTFSDITEKAGLHDAGWAVGVCVGDYDNDGFEDLFITYYGQNKLYHNNGNGTFTDVTAKAGLLCPGVHFGSGCTFIERNRNGQLDLFVANYADIDLTHGPRPSLEIPNCNFNGIPVNCGPGGLPAPRHFLYRNNGDGTFTDVSKESGILALKGSYGLTAVACDFDEDSWPDIFVACDATFSLLLINNRDGTFREEGLLRGIAVDGRGRRMGGMGVGVGDYQLDGHLHILRTHFYKQAPGLYRNDGKGNFDDLTDMVGLGHEQRFINWGAGLADLDNDGWPDIFIASGTVYPELERSYPERFPSRTPRLIFRNQGDGTFVELGNEAGPGISALHNSRGVAFGDFDNDGDLDILVMNRNEPPSLLRNDAPAKNHWIKVRLVGTRSNRSAIGARVLAHYNGRVQAQAVTSQCSYVSANDPRLHFGLGGSRSADFDIFWPSGLRETWRGLAADRLYVLREGESLKTKSNPDAAALR
ncbi:MAG TPA: CRTAC1 family protein [Acidobacteriaceae bacterium]